MVTFKCFFMRPALEATRPLARDNPVISGADRGISGLQTARQSGGTNSAKWVNIWTIDFSPSPPSSNVKGPDKRAANASSKANSEKDKSGRHFSLKISMKSQTGKLKIPEIGLFSFQIQKPLLAKVKVRVRNVLESFKKVMEIGILQMYLWGWHCGITSKATALGQQHQQPLFTSLCVAAAPLPIQVPAEKPGKQLFTGDLVKLLAFAHCCLLGSEPTTKGLPVCLPLHKSDLQ